MAFTALRLVYWFLNASRVLTLVDYYYSSRERKKYVRNINNGLRMPRREKMWHRILWHLWETLSLERVADEMKGCAKVSNILHFATKRAHPLNNITTDITPPPMPTRNPCIPSTRHVFNCCSTVVASLRRSHPLCWEPLSLLQRLLKFTSFRKTGKRKRKRLLKRLTPRQ